MYRINAPGINNAFQIENFYFGGQPNQEGFQYFLDQGVKKIYNLRGIGEDDFSGQEAFLQEKGIEYIHLPFLGETGFNADCVNALGELKQGPEEEKILIHCASGNRIGAWYIIYLVQVKGLDFEAAYEEGVKAGLTNPGLAQAVRQFLGL